MIRVHIIPDPFDKSTWFSEDVSNVCEFLYSHYDGKLPENTKIYEGGISEDREITPKTKEDVIYLQSVNYDIFVVQYPSFAPLAILAIVNVVLTVVAAVFVFMSMPKIENTNPKSPNNELSRRVNQARINGRIPDIYGQVRSTPDLISEPFLYYDANGKEIEECVMGVGRGYYLIEDCKDGDTDVEAIDGSSVSFYDPNTSLTGAAIYQAGAPFTQNPKDVISSSAINGQSLEKPNDTAFSSGLYFETGGIIKSLTNVNFTNLFSVGDGLGISGAQFGVKDVLLSGETTLNASGSIVMTRSQNIEDFASFQNISITGANASKVVGTETVYFDLSGVYRIYSATRTTSGGNYIYTFNLNNPISTNPNWSQIDASIDLTTGVELKDSTASLDLDEFYTVESVTSSQIKLTNAAVVNPEWLKIETLFNGTTQGLTLNDEVSIDKLNNKWIGWFDIKMANAKQAAFNLIAPNGISNVTNKGRFTHAYLEVTIQCEAYDSNNNKIGNTISRVEFFEYATRDQVARTLYLNLPNGTHKARFRVAKTRAETRNSPIVEMKIKSVYLIKDSEKTQYPITVVRTRMVGTERALSLKERRLNALVTRKLPLNGTGALTPTKQADQIIVNMALDPKIGRRSEYEVDTTQIVSEIQKARNYFGSDLSTEFCYTFDDKQLSFEESVGMVAAACFCEVYRFGSKLRARFEAPQNDSIILFNHRNKVIGSEKRTYEYGIENGYDGITLEYTSPLDDARINYKIPEDGSAINPLEIKTSGIRNEKQAKTRAWREWNKLQYKNLSIEFEALYESEILARNDRILVADNTNTKTQDGEIEWVEGLEIGTSQPVDFSASGDYFVHLQLPSGKTDVISCAQGSDDYSILLSRAPSESLVVDEGKRVQATYLLVVGNGEDKIAFMVSTIDPATDNSNSIKGFNYDSRFYEKDHHFF